MRRSRHTAQGLCRFRALSVLVREADPGGTLPGCRSGSPSGLTRPAWLKHTGSTRKSQPQNFIFSDLYRFDPVHLCKMTGLTRFANRGMIGGIKGGCIMPASEKKRKADTAWKTKNLKTIACRVYRADAVAFQEYAAAQGRSVNDVLREYVAQCLGRPLERRTAADDEPENETE